RVHIWVIRQKVNARPTTVAVGNFKYRVGDGIGRQWQIGVIAYLDGDYGAGNIILVRALIPPGHAIAFVLDRFGDITGDELLFGFFRLVRRHLRGADHEVFVRAQSCWFRIEKRAACKGYARITYAGDGRYDGAG